MTDEFTNKGFLRAGELARAANVSTDTLRHYERKGVLTKPRRSRNGYREYPPEALARVRLVRRALGVGFTLDELAQILKEREKGGAPCRAVRTLAAGKLAASYNVPALFENRALRAALGGWSVDSIFTARTAPPLTVVVTGLSLSPTESVVVREELRAALTNWDALLAGKNVVERAGLLEALASADSPRNQISLAPNWRRRNINRNKTNEEKPE